VSTHAFVDETKASGLLLVAAVLAPRDQAARTDPSTFATSGSRRAALPWASGWWQTPVPDPEQRRDDRQHDDDHRV